MKKSLIILTLAGALLGGCTALEKTSNTEKVDTLKVEKVIDMKAIEGVEYTLENSDVTIVFDNNKVYGFSGVNRYFGMAQVEGDNLKITNVASTMMAGPQSKMEAETEYLKTLSGVEKISVEKNTIILSGNNKVLKFVK